MNKKTLSFLLVAIFMSGGLLALIGCTISPSMGIGIDFDYYGGKFHARPTANIGITGRP
jgi:hypothetical protein